MKHTLLLWGVASLLTLSSLNADALSHSLNGMLHQSKKSPASSGMVNIDGLGLGAKKRPTGQAMQAAFHGRPGKTVIGHYNDNKPVYKKEADKYIRKVTKGKIKDLDMLPRKQRLLVLSDLQKMYAMKHFKSRPESAVIAIVNGQKLYKKEANAFLKQVTGGKIADFDRLDSEQRRLLVDDLAKPIVIRQAVENEISQEDKEGILKQLWLEKKRASIVVTPEEMLSLYESKKAQSLVENPQAKIPPYISLGERLKNEIVEQRIMSEVMKDVNITINEESNETSENLDTLSIVQGE